MMRCAWGAAVSLSLLRESVAAAVEACAFFIEPRARPHVADVERQIAWYKAQGLIDKGVNARDVVYLNFVK